ncbi:MAG: triose-phosphate isomerase [Patescibacteria group bacterium]
MRSLIVANWKANPETASRAAILARAIEQGIRPYKNAEVIITPPSPFLIPVQSVIKNVRLGAQDAFWGRTGPHTGEVSWLQLKGLKIRHVIVGHSERRADIGETTEMVERKVVALLDNDMIPILCIGETERAADGGAEDGSFAAVADQIRKILRAVSKSRVKNLVIAYEPVWAISTTPGARPDTPDSAFRAMLYIRRILAEMFGRQAAELVRIIYGGSVTSANAAGFFAEGHMAGALVGGASLNPKEFIRIVQAASLAGPASK